jgi:hypothetical protein
MPPNELDTRDLIGSANLGTVEHRLVSTAPLWIRLLFDELLADRKKFAPRTERTGTKPSGWHNRWHSVLPDGTSFLLLKEENFVMFFLGVRWLSFSSTLLGLPLDISWSFFPPQLCDVRFPVVSLLHFIA